MTDTSGPREPIVPKPGKFYITVELDYLQGLERERDELKERHEIVSDTAKLKQMTIHELQSQRDTLTVDLKTAHDLLYQERTKFAALKAEVERLKSELRRIDLANKGSGIAAFDGFNEKESLRTKLSTAREALEKLIRFTTSLCEDVSVSTHYQSIENARTALRETGE